MIITQRLIKLSIMLTMCASSCAPFETMKSFISEVLNHKYVDSQLSFIQELTQ